MYVLKMKIFHEYLLLEIHKTINKDLTREIELFIEQNGLQDKWRTDWL